MKYIVRFDTTEKPVHGVSVRSGEAVADSLTAALDYLRDMELQGMAITAVEILSETFAEE